MAGAKKKARREGRILVFIDESGLSQGPHRCRTWAPRGQTPILQYNFNWKSLSVGAGLTLWNFYFRIYFGAIKKEQVVNFLGALVRQLHQPLLIVVGSSSGTPQPAGAGLHCRFTWLDFYCLFPPYAPELNPGRVHLGLLEAVRVAERLSKGLPGSSTGLTLNLLRDSHADTVLDVGANEGQFGEELKAFGATQKIISFEPVASAHSLLTKNSNGSANWVVAPMMALSDKAGSANIYVTKNSECSSLQPVAASGPKESSYFDLVATEEVPLERLDKAARMFVDQQAKIYLKIDVQGHEKEVIEGATGIWDKIVAMQIEVSFAEIYSG